MVLGNFQASLSGFLWLLSLVVPFSLLLCPLSVLPFSLLNWAFLLVAEAFLRERKVHVVELCCPHCGFNIRLSFVLPSHSWPHNVLLASLEVLDLSLERRLVR